MKTKRNKYYYHLLKSASQEIRLLRVLPQSGGTTHVSLEEVVLNDVNGQYDAISYVWGATTPHRHIVVDGKKLQVRDNIYQCLKHLRKYQMISKPLWIDCICINQADATEKEQQIANMSKIFSSASTVYVWLGKTSRLFQPEQNLGHAVLRDALQSSSSGGMFEALIQRQDPIALAIIDQLMRLVYDEYWHRLWIVQETALASDARVVMGNMLVDAKTLQSVYFTVRDASKPVYYAWLRWQNDADFEDRGTQILDTHPITGMWSQPDELDTGLTDLIQTYRTKLCTDPRDRIYGLLGLTRSRHRPPIDYKCSTEVLLLRTMNCLIAEAEDKHSQAFDGTDDQVVMFGPWIVACIMQCLETTAGKVQSAIATSSVLAQEYMRNFEVMLQAREVILPCIRAPEDRMTLEERCTSIQTPSGRVEHFWIRTSWFGRHIKRQFQVNERGVPFLICSIGLSPILLLSIDINQQVRVERLVSYDLSRTMRQTVQHKSRHVLPGIGSALSTKLNTLRTDWQDVFNGKFFCMRVSLSGLELVELAETWDLQATKYDPRDRDKDWRMTWEIRGQGSDVDDIAQVLRDSIDARL